MQNHSKIPATVITGYLGAGKTTLLNHFIGEYPEKKFAIIENEFGEISLDSELIINIDNGNICELANGCICCTLNEDLAGILKDLLRSGKEFNHLLIETTGIADPSTVIQTFFSDTEVRIRYEMDSVICLVDALHFAQSMKDGDETRKQAAISDVILLNKLDAADPVKVPEIKTELMRLNPKARIIETSYAATQGSDLLDARNYRTEQVESYALDITRMQSPDQDSHAISSYSFVFPGEFELEKFSFWMEYFLFINQSNLFRIKGILSFMDNPQKMILQSVRSAYLLDGGEFWEAGKERLNRLVMIGKDLDYKEIQEALSSLMGEA
jgi:G3E family GTPase